MLGKVQVPKLQLVPFSRIYEISDKITFHDLLPTLALQPQLETRHNSKHISWYDCLLFFHINDSQSTMFQSLPIYELVRFSTAAAQARTRLPFLKQAWVEYIQEFNPCRCAPCRNNGVPVLTRTSCSCLCKSGYYGLACEKTERKREGIFN